MSEILGHRITEQLTKLKMTQKELAQRACIREAALSRYISNSREPDYAILANIATALHTTVNYLLGEEEEDYSFNNLNVILARNAGNLSPEEKRILIS